MIHDVYMYVGFEWCAYIQLISASGAGAGAWCEWPGANQGQETELQILFIVGGFHKCGCPKMDGL